MKTGVIVLVVVLVVVAGGIFVMVNYGSSGMVDSFEDCVAAGNPVMESYPRQCRANGQLFVEEIDGPVAEGDLVSYFSKEMFESAVEKAGGAIPIEGYTPGMYIGLFENLEEEDFDNVRAVNGFYDFSDGELRFIMASGQLITSADGSLDERGHEDLLDNLEEKFGLEIYSKEDVDELIVLLG